MEPERKKYYSLKVVRGDKKNLASIIEQVERFRTAEKVLYNSMNCLLQCLEIFEEIYTYSPNLYAKLSHANPLPDNRFTRLQESLGMASIIYYKIAFDHGRLRDNVFSSNVLSLNDIARQLEQIYTSEDEFPLLAKKKTLHMENKIIENIVGVMSARDYHKYIIKVRNEEIAHLDYEKGIGHKMLLTEGNDIVLFPISKTKLLRNNFCYATMLYLINLAIKHVEDKQEELGQKIHSAIHDEFIERGAEEWRIIQS